MPQVGVPVDGPQIRDRREGLLLSQEGLAAKADIHPNTLQRMENDPDYRAGFKTVRKVARKLKCDPTALLRTEPADEVAS